MTHTKTNAAGQLDDIAALLDDRIADCNLKRLGAPLGLAGDRAFEGQDASVVEIGEELLRVLILGADHGVLNGAD